MDEVQDFSQPSIVDHPAFETLTEENKEIFFNLSGTIQMLSQQAIAESNFLREQKIILDNVKDQLNKISSVLIEKSDVRCSFIEWLFSLIFLLFPCCKPKRR